ncbi:DUF456 family protein [Pontibacillus yanchengensis]|uniref:DUF456 family protein n=2 Tax=Pontibacillus yanchengensis TaxID=462910 RepID=A0A6I5A5V4_9BACI|nr:DUF456 domain-containing protein [Pontibacillus yanchengensis]MYL35622.1 DUF456 family protein [Pontibacillus yanchengensis]MYL53682.1 DUF456 family protein [Pontibacillus yanchengensis]
MDMLLWVLVVAGFIVSYIGLIYPVLPSPLFLWISLLIYQFFINANELSIWFWITMILLTVLLIISDIIINSKAVKRFGGSKWGERMAAIGVIVGSFIIPPIGVIVVPFVLVFITEMVQKEDVEKAFKSSLGALVGFLGGTIAKLIIQTFIIIWFVISVFIW